MNPTDCATTDCPYCGEAIELVVDCSIEEQSYIEDCPVCCRPMSVWVQVGDDGSIDLQLRDENN
ncbi:MAG: CPXCG motif-containing cysteine-rich protein [Porticoccaceae bacterium]